MSQELLISEEVIARQSPEAQSIIRILQAKVAALEAEIAALKKAPRNSSLPPSTEHPHAKPVAQKGKSKKERGGQLGHLKHKRSLIPTEQCHDVVSVKPEVCRKCSSRLAGSDTQLLRHQVGKGNNGWNNSDTAYLAIGQITACRLFECNRFNCSELR